MDTDIARFYMKISIVQDIIPIYRPSDLICHK
jgi:hypothetical protein